MSQEQERERPQSHAQQPTEEQYQKWMDFYHSIAAMASRFVLAKHIRRLIALQRNEVITDDEIKNELIDDLPEMMTAVLTGLDRFWSSVQEDHIREAAKKWPGLF